MLNAGSLVIVVLLVATIAGTTRGEVVVEDKNPPPRVQYGAARLDEALKSIGSSARVMVRTTEDVQRKPEGFRVLKGTDTPLQVIGNDPSGTLYGCLEVASRIRRGERYAGPIEDAPVMKLRGPCIGMQKTFIIPGRKVYEYPYTPDLFPFFYDKAMWNEYLDFLADNRFNSLYLWNGQPFASLVKVAGYEDVQEVDDATFARNQEMMRWLTVECDRRGIWLVQMFYSIILPKPLAEKHGLATQLKDPHPVAQDYIRKAITQFVKDYPNVSLMPCLGEALQGDENQKRWLIDTILGGIHDGMKEAGLKEEPPVLVRTHATDLRKIMPDALKVYKNLYTEAKFNGESLTTWEPRGKRQQVHLAMSQLGSTHMINVHILANLEPFRYGAQRFIQKSVQAGRDRLGAKGVHLYPLFYWNWPDSPDKVSPPLKQWDRDWIWFEAWARYAWNPDIPDAEDRAYWIARLSDRYGSKEAAEKILDAYNDAGECAPRILRRFGITEGNRQTMSLGMYLDQMVHPEKYRAFEELWESQSPPGERLQEYVAREWKKQPHEGETPPQICAEVLDFSAKAVDAIDAAAPMVSKNKDEFERLRNDVRCIRAMSQSYAAKATAAIHVLRYDLSKDLGDMDKAASYLAESLEHFRKLTELTKDTYNAANSMQTSQRKIPTSGGDRENKPANYHWTQVLPNYERELADFQTQVAALKQKGGVATVEEASIKPLPPASIKVLSDGAEAYEVKLGATVFTDRLYKIEKIAPELVGLTGIRFSHDAAKGGKYQPVEFETTEPVFVLIGYMKADRPFWLKVPDLETDALAAERGGIEPSIQNAATVTETPAIDVHALQFGKGKQKLEVRGSGSFVVLGVVPQSSQVNKRDARCPGGL